jgi:hypothetical protein
VAFWFDFIFNIPYDTCMTGLLKTLGFVCKTFNHVGNVVLVTQVIWWVYKKAKKNDEPR